MTHKLLKTLAGSPSQGPRKIDSLSTISLSTMLRKHALQLRSGPGCSDRRGRLSPGVAVHLVLALCVMTSAVWPANAGLWAQAPNVEVPDAVPGTSTTPAAVPNLPSDVEFDIDLGTEEFDNFGEEGFQVEEENYFRDTVVPIAIKVAIGAVVILLLAWVAKKLTEPKRPNRGE